MDRPSAAPNQAFSRLRAWSRHSDSNRGPAVYESVRSGHGPSEQSGGSFSWPCYPRFARGSDLGCAVQSTSRRQLGVDSSDFAADVLERIAGVHRVGEPVDVAGAVVYLASPASSLVTGTTPHGGRRLDRSLRLRRGRDPAQPTSIRTGRGREIGAWSAPSMRPMVTDHHRRIVTAGG
jgi:hypothetical protein